MDVVFLCYAVNSHAQTFKHATQKNINNKNNNKRNYHYHHHYHYQKCCVASKTKQYILGT